METPISIGKRSVGAGHPPYIIAEMSGNHNQSLERALALVEAAAKAGAHALKLQTYTADTMTLDLDEGEFHISDPHSPWHGYSLYQLYQQAHTPWEWHKPIMELGGRLGLDVFSTPFDATAVEFLESLEVPCYKIASFENTDLPLIRRVAATGKPMIVSTGMATQEELQEAVSAAHQAGCKDLVLLKCTSAYPALPQSYNLATLADLRSRFDCQAGISDHSLGLAVPLAAVALGATVIEKHFTLSRADGGVDAAFSLEPAELEELVRATESSWQALGEVRYGPGTEELGSLQFRRSLYIVRDVAAGQKLGPEHLRAIRPGMGLSPKFYDVLIGRTAARDLKRGMAVQWNFFERGEA